MQDIFIVYPHQLFKDITPLKDKKVLLIEESLFFTQFAFHIQKLILHRASMKFYEDYLHSHNIDVEYFEDESYLDIYKKESIFIYDVVDDWLLKKIQNNFKTLTVFYNPNFLNVNDSNRFLHKYYINRRKELNLFVEDGKPYGGKWSFDEQNRKKLPKDEKPICALTFSNRYIDEAKDYCKKFAFVGESKEFYYPVTFDEANKNLEYFLKYKFERYGDYQDAIVKNENFLYHSNISSSLNIGLLDLNQIIETIKNYDVSYNSKEGFIRQIIGWREFVFNVYKSSHIPMRNSNFFGFKNTIPKKLISAQSSLAPLDDAVLKLKKSAYNHHIERLMILGNIFVLLECEPSEVYEFFMANYIDAYDWVMVANVYGMSGFSDGGSIVTKPYISSSNYIIKMSNNYKKSEPWCEIWDGLYWRFLDKYKHLFQNNHRMKMQLSLLEKMPNEKLQKHIDTADKFIKEIRDEL
jgi:deoxyribodipyrimidine photolyase-related protein